MFFGIKGGYFDFDKAFSVPRTPERRVLQYELELSATSGSNGVINGQEFERTEGCVVFAKPGDVRFSEGSYKCRYLHFSCEDAEFEDKYLSSLPAQIVFEDVEFLRKSMCEILLSENSETSEGKELAKSLLKAVLIKLHISAGMALDSGRYSSDIRRACAFIADNFGKNIGINEIAAAASLSPSFTYVEFKKSTGFTPHGYLTKQRLEFACSQLIFTDKAVGEISTECGFENPNYLNYIFKKTYNLTPLTYRKKFRKVL